MQHWLPHLAWGFGKVDSVEQFLQFPIVDFQAWAFMSFHRLGDPEQSLVQPFVENAHPSAVVEQNLDGVLLLSVENKQCATTDIPSDFLRHHSGQPIEAPAQIDRIQAKVNLHALRNHRTCSLRIANTDRKVAASNPILISTLDLPSQMETPDFVG